MYWYRLYIKWDYNNKNVQRQRCTIEFCEKPRKSIEEMLTECVWNRSNELSCSILKVKAFLGQK
jgi:hypothetical protein